MTGNFVIQSVPGIIAIWCMRCEVWLGSLYHALPSGYDLSMCTERSGNFVLTQGSSRKKVKSKAIKGSVLSRIRNLKKGQERNEIGVPNLSGLQYTDDASFLSFLSFSMSIHVPSTIYTFDPCDMSLPNDDNKNHACLLKLLLGTLRAEWDAVV